MAVAVAVAVPGCFRAISAWGCMRVSAASSVKAVIPFPWTGLSFFLSFFFSLPYFLLPPLAADMTIVKNETLSSNVEQETLLV